MKNKPNPIRNALLFFMKITLIHMLITSVTVMMGYAVDSSGQEVLERKLTLQTENADVKTVLAEIEKKSRRKIYLQAANNQGYRKCEPRRKRGPLI